MDKAELVPWWVLGHPAQLFGLLCCLFFFLVQVYEPTNNPLIVEVDAHSIGGLSFTPGESPEGGPFPHASLPQVVALSRGPSFREGQALPQYFFGHGQFFFKCFLKKQKQMDKIHCKDNEQYKCF
jgi:hypothetical protein